MSQSAGQERGEGHQGGGDEGGGDDQRGGKGCSEGGEEQGGHFPQSTSGEEQEEPQPRLNTTSQEDREGGREVWQGTVGVGYLGRGERHEVVLPSDKTEVRQNLFRILYTNARSIIGKIDLLRTYVCDLKPSVVCICEASTNSLTSDAFLSLDGYNLVVRADGLDTNNGWCRGLLIYVRVGVKAARLESTIIG